MARIELRPEDLTAVCDTREQRPLDLQPMQTKRETLTTGDYSVAGLENVVTVERKSLDDLLGCIGQERERFDREMIRILAYPHKMLLIEATWADIRAGKWRQKVHANAVAGSLLGWMSKGVPVFFAPDHDSAGGIARHFLFLSARRRWEEARAMCPFLKIAGEKDG
jgi:ERCC4-type nuclease